MDGNILVTIITNLMTFITGNFGKSMCVLLIIFSGVMWWFKKFNTGTAVSIVGGTALVFGAAYFGTTIFGITVGG